MAFRRHPTEERIVDPKRGMELVRVGAGPMSFKAFAIQGLEKPDWFWAAQTVTPKSKGPPGTYTGDPMWVIIIQTKYTQDQRARYEPIVAEAMIAYRSLFGQPVNDWTYCVEFLPWGTDYEDRNVQGTRYTEVDLFR